MINRDIDKKIEIKKPHFTVWLLVFILKFIL